jgi:hypothetical protein
VLDERRSSVIEALENRSQKLTGMYKTALTSLFSEPDPGCETARVSVICHCMRELMLGLPAAMAVTNTSIQHREKSSGSQLQDLPRILADHPGTDLELDQDLVPVPRAVAHAFAALVSAATREDGRNRANTAALITGGSDASHPAIKQWTDAYNFFLGWAHLDRNQDSERSLPSDQTLTANMRVVEDVIEVKTALFFENLHALEDLLTDINSVEEDGA